MTAVQVTEVVCSIVRITIAVPICIPIIGRKIKPFIHIAIAVIIFAITVFSGRGVYGRNSIITISIVRHL